MNPPDNAPPEPSNPPGSSAASSEADQEVCQKCSTRLRHGRAGDLCPACLIAGALDADEPTLDAPGAPRSLSDPSADLILGTTIAGRYKILQSIGEGGFGTVYMTEQTEPVRRRVALKVLKAGMDTRRVVARFEAERQALAVMDHPNISSVFDGGETENGRPFFVMELVRGIPVTKFCEDTKLPIEERLQLFIQICGAVQHAHQKGIIHRDLKPSNILITTPDGAEPVPKVIDFGVAKAVDNPLTDKTLFTRFEEMVGTPAYMSPEQAAPTAQDIDTRADIYALGTLLYELLTGTTPFESETLQKAAFDEVRRILREEEPPKPSTRLTNLRQRPGSAQIESPPPATRPDIPRDLDWIAMKALDKDRRRRYDTANGLAQDVERFLENEPVSAGPPTARYRLSKFIRRNKVSVVTGATIAACLLIALGLVTWALLRATAAENNAIAAEKATAEEAAVARAVSDFLTEDLLEKASPKESPDRNIKLRTVLDAAADRVGESFANQPLVEAEIRATLTKTYSGIGLKREATEHAKRAAELFGDLLGPDHRKTLEMLSLREEFISNIDGLIAVLAKQRETLGPEHPDTLRSTINLGRIAFNHGREDNQINVEDLFENLIPILDRVFGPLHEDTLQSNKVLQQQRFRLKKHTEAEEGLRKVIELQSEVLGPEHPATLDSLATLGLFVVQDMDRFAEGEMLLRKTLETSRSVLGIEHVITQSLINNLVSTLFNKDLTQDQWNEVLSLEKENVSYHVRAFGIGDKATLGKIDRLGYFERLSGIEPKQALALAADAIESNRKEHGPMSRETLQATMCMIYTLENAERMDDASVVVFKALSEISAHLGTIPWDVVENVIDYSVNYGEWDAVWNIQRALRSSYPDQAANVLSKLAFVALFRRDSQSFEALRAELFERFGKTVSPHDAHEVAMILMAAPVEDASLLEKVDFQPSDRRINGVPLASKRNASFRALAVAFRSGKFERAREIIQMLEVTGVSMTTTSIELLLEDSEASTEGEKWLENFGSQLATMGSHGPIAPYSKYGDCLRLFLASELWREAEIKLTGDPNVPNRLVAAFMDSQIPTQAVQLMDGDAVWKYHYHRSASDPIANTPNFLRSFFLPSYDDSLWEDVQDSKGFIGGFGYGDPVGVEWELPEEGIRSSAYLRHRFETEQNFVELWLRCRFDDGIIVYLDGEEVGRVNATGEQTEEIRCWIADGRREECSLHAIRLRKPISPGPHVLAISLHNISAESSDLRIGEITLYGTSPSEAGVSE